MRRGQHGASGLFVAVILLLAAVAAIAVYALTRSAAQVERGTHAAAGFKILQDALLQYVAANGRLPCPADPALDTGDANPTAASAACNSPTGTVPWKDIGVRREDAIDPWGGKISYRVYAGVTGLTQADGASMVDCDTVEPASQGTAGGGLCRTTHDTTEAEFLNGKGMTVASFGAAKTDVAYVLVSHGPTGLGAFTTAGVQKPLPSSADEVANLSAAGPFVARAASAQGVGPEDAAHFDDLLAFAQIGDLIRGAGRGARDWPEPPSLYASIKLDTPTLTATLGSAPSYGNLGLSTINFTNAQLTAFDSGGSQNLSFGTTGGTEGIGVGGGSFSSAGLSSAGGEGVRIAFTQKAGKFALTLDDFGTGTIFIFGLPFTYSERVDITFYDGVTSLGTLSKFGCNADGGLATFSIDSVATLGGEFDSVEIRPNVTFPAFLDTEFLLSEFKSCAASDATCTTSLATVANTCP